MPNKEIYYPKKAQDGYYDRALGRFFKSKNEKRDYMNSHGLREDGSMENDRHRIKRLTDVINVEREKQGLKPKTKEELVGDSREAEKLAIYGKIRR